MAAKKVRQLMASFVAMAAKKEAALRAKTSTNMGGQARRGRAERGGARGRGRGRGRGGAARSSAADSGSRESSHDNEEMGRPKRRRKERFTRSEMAALLGSEEGDESEGEEEEDDEEEESEEDDTPDHPASRKRPAPTDDDAPSAKPEERARQKTIARSQLLPGHTSLLAEPSREEIKTNLMSSNLHRSPGDDGVTAELIRAALPWIITWMILIRTSSG